jgi:hypothetical protein
VSKFKRDYPAWTIQHTLSDIIEGIRERHQRGALTAWAL